MNTVIVNFQRLSGTLTVSFLLENVFQKSVEHQLQIARVIEKVADLVKSAVNSNVQREIMSAMSGVTSFTCNENLAEKAYEEEAEL